MDRFFSSPVASSWIRHHVCGSVAEWLNAPVLKTGVPQGIVSSNLTASARTSSQSPDFFQGFFFCGSLNMPFRISRPWLTGNPVWHLTGKLFPRTFPPACFSPSGLTSGQASASDCPPPLRDSWRHRQSQKRGKKPPAEQPCVTRTIRIAGEAAGAPGSGRFPAYPGHSCWPLKDKAALCPAMLPAFCGLRLHSVRPVVRQRRLCGFPLAVLAGLLRQRPDNTTCNTINKPCIQNIAATCIHIDHSTEQA